MKKYSVIIVLGWVLCGFYSFGTLMADMDYKNSHEWAILKRSSRDNLGDCVAPSLLGPIAAIVATLATNFNQHGWELWQPNQEGGR